MTTLYTFVSVVSSINSIKSSLEINNIDNILDDHDNNSCVNHECIRIKNKTVSKLEDIRNKKYLTSIIWLMISFTSFGISCEKFINNSSSKSTNLSTYMQ